MSPHRHEFLIFVGTVAGSWWGHLDPARKAMAAIVGVAAIVAVVAFAAGSMVSQIVIERSGALARLAQVEGDAARALRIAVRDSARLNDVEEEQTRVAEVLETIEDLARQTNERTLRLQCILQGNRGPACL